MAKSLMELISDLPEDERREVLSGFDQDALLWDWSVWGRPEQQAPEGDWAIWLYMAGRGAGKTRTASEWVREQAKYTAGGQRRFALVARTAADVRDVLVEGDSGIMKVTPPSEKPNYEPSKRRLTWPNGNVATCFTADEPDSLRGPQFTHAWGDEVAAWRQTPDGAGMTAFGNLRIATRLGRNPQMMLTTTPKRVPMLYDLLEEAKRTGRVVITRGSTLDNAGNLAASYIEGIQGMYGRSRLANQEIYGEMLDAMEGALWTDETINDNRSPMPNYAPLRIIGVDPTVAERPGDECGIVVVASTSEHDLYKRESWVLEDASIQGSPEVWANAVVRMARKYGCPVVAEVNQGGTLVRNAIHTIDPSIKVLEVHSKVGKQLRAEPVTLAYDQGRVHHVGSGLGILETQMTSWVPGEGKSPDRVDALVHALTALLIKPPTGFRGGSIRAKSLGSRRIGANTGTKGRFTVR